MNYFSFDITTPHYDEEKGDIITALLSELPFETFEDTGSGLKAYISEENLTENIEDHIIQLSETLDFQYIKTFIPYQNWNVLWESNFEPIRIDDFVTVRADFHAPTVDENGHQTVLFDLVINPKMAFGTGHHETTYMMMQLMRDINFDGKKVLDYGCGTGILAILASKLKAHHLEAVDIEAASYENTLENCRINNVYNIKAFEGTLDAIDATDFDIILANINRNVILDSLVSLKNKLNTEGVLLISGFLIDDENVMREAILNHQFKIVNTIQRGNWLCMHLHV